MRQLRWRLRILIVCVDVQRHGLVFFGPFLEKDARHAEDVERKHQRHADGHYDRTDGGYSTALVLS